MKKLVLIFATLTVCLSCKHHSQQWTEVYYQTLYSHFYETNGKFIKNENQRKQFTTYEIERLKVELPDGLSSVPIDSLTKVCARIGKEYNKTHAAGDLQETMTWSIEGDSAFKESVLSGNFIKSIDKKLRNKYCDCMLMEFKTMYPDSISVPVPDSIYSKVIHNCNLKLSINTN